VDYAAGDVFHVSHPAFFAAQVCVRNGSKADIDLTLFY
jgi:hypothetical protein